MKNESNNSQCRREHDFALVIYDVPELTIEIESKLFDAGCDDATFSIQYGALYAEFSRDAQCLKDAVLSAIGHVRKAGIGAKEMRVDECELVTQAEIARKINRSRQLVNQYISGQRGPGNFPAPACHLSEGVPLWQWCAVSFWLAQHNIIRPEEGWNAQVVAVINLSLEHQQLESRDPKLMHEIEEYLGNAAPC